MSDNDYYERKKELRENLQKGIDQIDALPEGVLKEAGRIYIEIASASARATEQIENWYSEDEVEGQTFDILDDFHSLILYLCQSAMLAAVDEDGLDPDFVLRGISAGVFQVLICAFQMGRAYGDGSEAQDDHKE